MKVFDLNHSYALEKEVLFASLESKGYLENIGFQLSSLLNKGKGLLTFNKPNKLRIKTTTLNSKPKKEMSFLIYGERMFVVPEGFKGNILEYGEDLLTVSQQVFDNTPVLLDNLNKFLARTITQKDYLEKGFTLDNDYKKLTKLTDKRASYFSKEATAVQPLNKILNSKKELEDYSLMASDLNTLISNLKLEAIDKQTVELTGLLDVIIESFKEEDVSAAKTKLKELINYVDALSEHLRLTSILYYECQVYINIHNDIIDKINQSF